MKILVAIKSCVQHCEEGYHDLIRKTWGSFVPAEMDLKFFMGVPDGTQRMFLTRSDEMFLSVADAYEFLPLKTRGILEFSVKQGYDFTWLCDTDTYTDLFALLRSDFWRYDYFGVNDRPWGKTFEYDAIDRQGNHWHGPKYAWCSGGIGYCLSKAAAENIISPTPFIWAEDVWVGQILGPLFAKGVLKPGNMQRDTISWHAPRRWDFNGVAAWMRKKHEERR